MAPVSLGGGQGSFLGGLLETRVMAFSVEDIGDRFAVNAVEGRIQDVESRALGSRSTHKVGDCSKGKQVRPLKEHRL